MNWLNNLDQVVDRLQNDQDRSNAVPSSDTDLSVQLSSSSNERDMMVMMIDPLLADISYSDSNNNPDTITPHDQLREGLSRLAETISSRMPQLPSSRPQRPVLYNKSNANSAEFDDFLSVANVAAPRINQTMLLPSIAIEPKIGYLKTPEETGISEMELNIGHDDLDVCRGLDLEPSRDDGLLILSSEQSTGDVTTEQPQEESEQSQSLNKGHMHPSPMFHGDIDQPATQFWNIETEPEQLADDSDQIKGPPMLPLHIWESSPEMEDFSDLKVSFPLEDWNPSTIRPFDHSLNRLGVVQVRVLAAQRLPCPVGSIVQAIVALPPWKGRIRSERSTTIGGPLEHGVIARWDQLNEASVCSMVHAWNSCETPVPFIKIDLMFNPIKLLEFAIFSLTLSCEPLLQEPGTWKKQWFQAEAASPLTDSMKLRDGHTPLILLEAAFFPAEDDDTNNAPDESVDEARAIVSNHNKVERTESHDESMDGSRHSRRSRGTNSSLSYMLTSRNKPHLLRVHSFWVPANCSVCSKSIIGWKRGYRCEVCNIDCCVDCQLQIDIQIPCGSGQAKAAVEKSIQNKMTVNNMLATLAPFDESHKDQAAWKQPHISRHNKKPGINASFESESKNDSTAKGIGVIKINIHYARLFAQNLHPDSDPTDIFDNEQKLRQADLYVRITPRGKNQKSVRTKLVQNSGAPVFDSDEFILNVPDYAMEYRLELVDASSEKPIGSTLLTAQSLLQLQRDEMIAEKGLFAFVRGLRHPERFTKQRRLALELRAGLKSGFGSDYYIPAKTKLGKGEGRAGEITGWLSIDACVKESADELFGATPIECPPRPPDDLNTDLFQIHIGRIANILRDIKKSFNGYLYVVSWKDPALTALSFVVFISLTLRFNTEYVGSLPVFSLVCYMFYLAYVRTSGHLKDRFIERERESRTQAEKEATVNYSFHRPLGLIEVSLRRGKNLRSRDLGLPGSVGCHIIWDPTRYVKNEKEVSQLCSVDKVLKSAHTIGDTNYLYTANPVWTQMIPSDETKRLQQLLPREGSFFTLESDKNREKNVAVEFPVPQPMHAIEIPEKSITEDGSPNIRYGLEPWSTCPGAIVVQVRMSDVINKLRLDDVLGEVSIPISRIADSGEIKGWFQVLDTGATHSVPVGGKEDGGVESNDAPLIYLHFKWKCPDASLIVTDTNREASIVVTEELMRSAVKAAASKIDLIGSSIGAINTMRGLTGNIAAIQNSLGSILDIVEGVRNAFNFTVCYSTRRVSIGYYTGNSLNSIPCTGSIQVIDCVAPIGDNLVVLSSSANSSVNPCRRNWTVLSNILFCFLVGESFTRKGDTQSRTIVVYTSNIC